MSSAEMQSLPDAGTQPHPRLTDVKILTTVSIIVPTYHEAENMPELLQRLEALRRSSAMNLELLIMDDDSRDGTEDVVAKSGHDWARVVTRTQDRGLSPAVVEGLQKAQHAVLVVMDADLSHPCEKIPEMILALDAGQQFVIGSRYVSGARTDEDWGFFRWINSRIATLLARPFSSARDPMSGFFALRRSDFLKADYLNPIGYKIGLELIVKCRLENIGEVPIYFADRKRGQSKLSFKEQLRYIQHLRRLFIYKFGTWSRALHFLAVGASGTLVNLGVLTALLHSHASKDVAIAGGIGVSIVSNFLLNRRFTFSYARHESMVRQFLGFCVASSFGALLNFAIAKVFSNAFPGLPLQVAAAVGILAGMSLNFVANRYLVFREKRIKSGGRA